MLYGVSYYPEYQRVDRLETDVAMMRDAGINYARIGDSIWSLCEPSPGQIDVTWLRHVLDALHAADIQVILCTPTYAIPRWLGLEHPEIMNHHPDGRALAYGDRQNVNFTHPLYRSAAERIIRALMSTYATHPAVIGVQVDNETGGRPLNGEDIEAEFRRRLRDRYGDAATVNERWGLNYWSHRITDIDQLWPHVGTTNPGHDLEWRRFQSELVTEFLTWQAEIVREYLREDQFVIHDLVGGHGLPHADRRQIDEVMDRAAENFPHEVQDHLAHPPAGPYGPQQLFQRCDMARAGRHQNFLVTEMNPISVGGPAHTFVPYDGQWRLAAYTCISRGADAIAYWHWHSLHFGSETYSHGVLGHDLEPNRCLAEVSTIGHELAEVGDDLTGLAPEAEVCMVYSPDSRYSLGFQPCLTSPGTSTPDPHCYARIFDAFYRAFFDERAQLTVTQTVDDLARYPVVVAPALYVADDTTLAALAQYAEDGGHLVLSFRTGYADQYARARQERAPGPLRRVTGAGYNLYSNLERPLPVRGVGIDLDPGASAEGWMDELVLEGAQPLVTYVHPFFDRFPAVVTHTAGRGRVTYVGTLPDVALGRSVARRILHDAGVQVAGAGLPEPVRVSRARDRNGHTLTFVSNWSAEQLTVPTPADGADLHSGQRIGGGEGLTLQPWGMRIIQ